MPRTKFHDNDKNKKPIPEVDLQDLSYKGMWRRRQVEQMEVEASLKCKLENINAELRSDRLGVTVIAQGDLIYLVAILPLKPGDSAPKGRKRKQYKISINGTGFPFSVDGLNEAENEARDLGLLKRKGLFQWTERYLGEKAPLEQPAEQSKTIGELLVEFEKKYFQKRKRNRKSERTFGNYIYLLKRFLPTNKVLTKEVMLDALQKTEPESRTRWDFIISLSTFCNVIKLKHDIPLGEYKKGYSPKQRNLPNNEEIEQYFDAFKPRERTKCDTAPDNWKEYQWHYGIMATYGLRPEESFAIDLEKFTDPSNTKKVLYLNEVIVDGLKTGNRVIFPLHKKWVDQFDLMNPKLLQSKAQLKDKVSLLSKAFRRYGIPFVPYDLRHAFAIRGHVLGIHPNEMGKNMGHSLEIHIKIYQRWMGLDARIQLWDKMEAQIEQQQQEQTELDRLKAELEAMKTELAHTQKELTLERAERLQLQTERHRIYLEKEQLKHQLQELHQDFPQWCLKRDTQGLT